MLFKIHVLLILFIGGIIYSCSNRDAKESDVSAIEKIDPSRINSDSLYICTDCYRTIVMNFYDGKKWQLLGDEYSYQYYYLTLYIDSSGSLVNEKNKKIFHSSFFIDYLSEDEINLFSTQIDKAPFIFIDNIGDWDTNNDVSFYLDTMFTNKMMISYKTHLFIGADKYPEPNCFYNYNPLNNYDLKLEDFIKLSDDFKRYIKRSFEKNKQQICQEYDEDTLDISDPCGATDPMMFVYPYDYSKIKLDNDTFGLVSIEQKGIRISVNTIDNLKSYKRTPCFEEHEVEIRGPIYRTFSMVLPIDSIQPYLNLNNKYGLYFKRK